MASNHTGPAVSRRHGEPDNFNEAVIRSGLATRIFGRAGFHFFDEIGSTNDQAALLAKGGSPEGTVVIADRQSRGRGQKERKWFSPPGAGIYLSLILRPAVPPGEVPKITLLTAVAVAETLISLAGLDIRIKWPNDLNVNGRKIAGILAEADQEAGVVNHVIVGAGINVNVRRDILPDDLKDSATSVLIESGKEMSRSVIVRGFLMAFELHYDAFLRGGFEAILERWKKHARVTGERVSVDGGRLSGIVIDVDRNGSLVMTDEQGRTHTISSGEVQFL
jgi:BirA family biotin operon repressor/biotin-[acetyl-CoA-carboxylase] ligase